RRIRPLRRLARPARRRDRRRPSAARWWQTRRSARRPRDRTSGRADAKPRAPGPAPPSRDRESRGSDRSDRAGLAPAGFLETWHLAAQDRHRSCPCKALFIKALRAVFPWLPWAEVV